MPALMLLIQHILLWLVTILMFFFLMHRAELINYKPLYLPILLPILRLPNLALIAIILSLEIKMELYISTKDFAVVVLLDLFQIKLSVHYVLRKWLDALYALAQVHAKVVCLDIT